MIQLPVYLDNNATTRCDPRVLEAMLPYFSEKFGNAASSTHAFGWEAAEAVDHAREQAAALIGAVPQEIVFTSGATEAVNLALKGVFEAYRTKGNHIITCVTEHKAVLDTCRHLERTGAEITYLPVNREGMLSLQELEAAITTQTILIVIMHANNETGVIHPIREIGSIAHSKGILFFTDASQSAGKIPVQVKDYGIHLLALSAHKIYGPKGAGALYVRRRDPRVKLAAQIDGGGHERGMRSGTLNVPGIVGLGMAAGLCLSEMGTEAVRLATLRDKLENTLLQTGEVQVNGSPQHRLPHVTNLSFRHADGRGLLTALNREIALSSGSACTSALMEPSYVLKALGLADELAYASLRFGLGRFTTAEDIDYAIGKITAELSRQHLQR